MHSDAKAKKTMEQQTPWTELFSAGDNDMAFRKKMKRSKSKKQFSKYADKTHRKNIDPRPMRGGIRL